MAVTAAKINTGRRKEAVARVRLVPGEGNFSVNGRSLDDYFPTRVHRMVAVSPLRLVGREKDFDVITTIRGGGISGQAGAIVHATARALLKSDETHKLALREAGLLTRDAREKERKKYGLKRARKAPQYTKR